MSLLLAASSLVGCATSGPGGELSPAGTTPVSPPTATPMATAEPDLAAPANPEAIMVDGAHLFGWALFDTTTATMTGSANADSVTNTVESMIKPWVAADYLRRQAEAGRRPSPQVLRELALMIVDSNDPLTEKYFQLGGGDAVTSRLERICGLRDVEITPDRWSQTELTPRDAVAYGRCLADGRAGGPQWTAWVLDTMKLVRGRVRDQISGEVQGGRWGIIEGLPPALAAEVSIKNGWTAYRDGWHINCLAVHPEWTLAVMLRVRSLMAGAAACRSVANALVAP